MKAARILVLAIALAAGGAPAFFISTNEEKKPEAPPVARMETISLLIAKSGIGMDTAVTGGELQFVTPSLALVSLPDASKVGETDGRKPDINTVRFGVSTT
jgi:hypothetical protein